MPTEHKISTLKINKLTDAQYNSITKSASELYLTPDDGDGLPDQTGNSGKFLTTNGTTASWATVQSGGGSVTSVQVQATSPVVSSVNTAQTTSLNTTISLADGYGDTKNPYASKTANTVLAAPNGSNGAPSFRALVKADIPLASETASSGGTTTSLVTTGEKYTWNNKQNALSTQTAYTSKGSATKVPQITTNTLGQVTGITEVDITHQSIKTLKTDNTTAQSTSSSEAVAGSGTINLHKVSKTGSYNDLLNKPTIPQGTVTSVQVQAGTGLSSSTSTAQNTTLSTTISVASGYKLPTTTEWSNKQDALPTQSGNSGKFLTTNGSTLSWGTVDALPDQTGNSGKFLTTNGSTASWAEIQGGSDIDNSTITKNTNDELQTVGIKDVRTDNTIKTWTGNKSQYDNLAFSSWSTPTRGENFNNASNWYSLAYGDGKFVVLAGNGYTSTSTDGTTWTSATQNNNFKNRSWSSLAYGDGKFVAISEYGSCISTSTDGINWSTATQVSNLRNIPRYALAYGNGKFVAISEYDGYVSTSTDGINWTQDEQNSNLSGYNWYSLIYGNNKFVALNPSGYISTSTDGINWDEPIFIDNLDGYGSYWYNTLAYDGSKFIILSRDSYMSTSIDGITWEIPTLVNALVPTIHNYTWWNLIYADSKLVALSSEGYISTKNDGIDSYTLYNVVNNGLYLGTDQISKLINTDDSTITKNTNDEIQAVGVKDVRTDNIIQTWTGTKAQYDALINADWAFATQISNIEGYYWKGLAYGNGKFVTLSEEGYISTSTDGTTWTPATYVSNLEFCFWSSITYGGKKFVALDSYGSIATSIDGTTWTPATSVSNLSDVSDWVSIVYGDGKFVALNYNGYISTSTDGTTWTAATQVSNLSNNNWNSLTYGNDKYVALTENGYISTSTDGITWTSAVQDSNLGYNFWLAITYGNGKFIALSEICYVSESFDGTTWTPATYVSNLGENGWNMLAYGNNKFVALNGSAFSVSTKNGGVNTNTLYNISNYGLYLGTDQIARGGDSLSEVSVVVETYKNGASWYRKWSDGWVEQGSIIDHGSNIRDFDGNITFLVPYPNTNYILTFAATKDGSSNCVGSVGTKSKTATSVIACFYGNSSSETARYIMWKAEGYYI